MTRLAILFTAAVILAGCWKNELSTVLPFEEAKKMKRPCSRPFPAGLDGWWKPTSEDIERADRRLTSAVDAAFQRLEAKWREHRPDRYYRQYAGFVRDGKRVLYVNALGRRLRDGERWSRSYTAPKVVVPPCRETRLPQRNSRLRPPAAPGREHSRRTLPNRRPSSCSCRSVGGPGHSNTRSPLCHRRPSRHRRFPAWGRRCHSPESPASRQVQERKDSPSQLLPEYPGYARPVGFPARSWPACRRILAALGRRPDQLVPTRRTL
jgi:hypothetical protein